MFYHILSCTLLLGQSSVLPRVDSFGLFGFCDFVNACQCDVLEPDCCSGMFGSNRFLSSVQWQVQAQVTILDEANVFISNLTLSDFIIFIFVAQCQSESLHAKDQITGYPSRQIVSAWRWNASTSSQKRSYTCSTMDKVPVLAQKTINNGYSFGQSYSVHWRVMGGGPIIPPTVHTPLEYF